MTDQRRVRLLLSPLTLLVALVGLIASVTVSGNAAHGTETRVRAFDTPTVDAVGPQTDETPGGVGRLRQVSTAIVSGSGVATNTGDDLLGQARAARDARSAAELAKATGKQKPPAAVSAGYDPATGRIATGCSSNPIGCAEDDIARQLRIPKSDVQFTEAVRPRTGGEVPICHWCQSGTSPSQYPPTVQVTRDGPWGR